MTHTPSLPPYPDSFQGDIGGKCVFRFRRRRSLGCTLCTRSNPCCFVLSSQDGRQCTPVVRRHWCPVWVCACVSLRLCLTVSVCVDLQNKHKYFVFVIVCLCTHTYVHTYIHTRSAEALPREQSVQEEAPARAYVPDPQSSHLSAPMPEKVPRRHSLHTCM